MKLWPLIKKRIALERNQKLSGEQFEAQQLRKFRILVRYPYQRSPFYRYVFQCKGIPIEACTPKDFRALTKREMVDHFNRLVSNQRMKKTKRH